VIEWLDRLRPEQRDYLRISGAVALAAGTLALFIRKSSHDQWGSFGRLLVLLIPCVVLYGLGLGMGDTATRPTWLAPVDAGLLVRAKRSAPAWQSVSVVLGVILIPFVFFQFLDAVGGNTGDSLNAAWIFLATASVALYAAFATGVSYASLLGALSLVIAWLAFCNKLLNPSASTFRWLLIVIAVGLVVAARELERYEIRQAPEFVTGAGLAAVAAGVLGLIGAAVSFLGTSIARSFGTTSTPVSGLRQHQEWDILLVVAALLLIWYGSRRGVRGPTYVGGLALAAFIVSVGLELTSLFAGKGPSTGDFIGWPALLLIVGIGGLAGGFWRPRADVGGPPPEQQPPLPPEPV
jgi:hypothetical protein